MLGLRGFFENVNDLVMSSTNRKQPQIEILMSVWKTGVKSQVGTVQRQIRTSTVYGSGTDFNGQLV